MSLYPFILYQVFSCFTPACWQTGASLNTMVRVASLVPQPFVFSVLNLTVAKVDSITLVDLIYTQCLSWEVIEGKEDILGLCKTLTGLFGIQRHYMQQRPAPSWVPYRYHVSFPLSSVARFSASCQGYWRFYPNNAFILTY